VALLSDDDYATLQACIALDPEQGDVIRGGGNPEVRWAVQGRGKRGGIRVISETATVRALVKEL